MNLVLFCYQRSIFTSQWTSDLNSSKRIVTSQCRKAVGNYKKYIEIRKLKKKEINKETKS